MASNGTMMCWGMECEDGTKWYNDVPGYGVRTTPNGTMMCREMECENDTKWYNDVPGHGVLGWHQMVQ